MSSPRRSHSSTLRALRLARATKACPPSAERPCGIREVPSPIIEPDEAQRHMAGRWSSLVRQNPGRSWLDRPVKFSTLSNRIRA